MTEMQNVGTKELLAENLAVRDTSRLIHFNFIKMIDIILVDDDDDLGFRARRYFILITNTASTISTSSPKHRLPLGQHHLHEAVGGPEEAPAAQRVCRDQQQAGPAGGGDQRGQQSAAAARTSGQQRRQQHHRVQVQVAADGQADQTRPPPLCQGGRGRVREPAAPPGTGPGSS